MADEEDEDGASGPPTLTPTTSHPPAATVTWLVQGKALLFGGYNSISNWLGPILYG